MSITDNRRSATKRGVMLYQITLAIILRAAKNDSQGDLIKHWQRLAERNLFLLTPSAIPFPALRFGGEARRVALRIFHQTFYMQDSFTPGQGTDFVGCAGAAHAARQHGRGDQRSSFLLLQAHQVTND